MVFQDPMTSLNPVLQIGFQVAETIITISQNRSHKGSLPGQGQQELTLEQILKLLKEGATEQRLTNTLNRRGCMGLRDQVLSVWRRSDLGEAKKEKIIMSLHSEKLGSFEKMVSAECRKRKGIYAAG